MNMGDLVFQLLMFLFIIGIFFLPFYLVRSFGKRQEKKSNQIEEKLDRIIELLEQEKKK